jgi:hypothetical protein
MRARHLELSVYDCERKSALHQIKRIAAKLFEAPARENLKVIAFSGG